MRKISLLILLLAAFALASSPVLSAEGGAAPAAPADAGKKDAPKDAKDAKKDSKDDKKGEGEKKSGPADVSGGRFAGDPVYVHLSPMIFPIITQAGAEQIVTLQISIEVKDFDAADDVHTNMPRVNDAIMRALYGHMSEGNMRNGVFVDVTRVKAMATKAIGEVIGADNVREVLIEAVAQRRL